MQAEVLRAKIAALRAAYDEVAALACRLPAQRHRMLAPLQAQTIPRELGAKSYTGQPRINHYHQTRKTPPTPADAWTSEPPPADHEPPADDERAGDEPLGSDESATNDDNRIGESSDPDPPDDKAA